MGKAVWDDFSTEVLVNACVYQKKEHNGLAFTKPGWKNIVTTFVQQTRKAYGSKQLKNRLEILKKELRTWDALLKETGAGRDPIKNVVSASNEWWQEKIKASKGYRKFRYNALRFENQRRMIFKGVVATMDDVEGSGDNEDERVGADPIPNAGVSTGLGSMKKRKRGEGPIHKKKQKILASKQIIDAMSVIATPSPSPDRAERCDDIHADSVKNVMFELFALEEVQCDEKFRNQCATLMLDEVNREMFVSFLENKEYLLSWLRFMVHLP